MRKTTIGITLIILAMILTACGSSNSPTASSSGSAASNRNGSSATASRNVALTPTTTLAIGTFKLEGTPETIDATEAAKLIPLWQLINQLDTSSSTAPQEITATVNAIQAAMTPMQIQTIHSMQISSRDIFTVLQQSGALPAGGFGGTGQNGSGSTRTGNGGNFTGGNRNGGGGGGNFIFGGSPLGGGNATATRTPNSSGTGTNGNGIGGFNTILVTQLIKLLQSKMQPG